MANAVSSDPDDVAAKPTPYRDAAMIYRHAGWQGVLPIPFGRKKFPPDGWTGHVDVWPSGADVQEWLDNPAPDQGGGNIALRMPPNLLGIDVDNYNGKTGATSLAEAVARWGELPPTYSSTARSDGVSRIRGYQIPEGLRWPGQLGLNIEIIQMTHRYMMVWPSVNPETGTTYRWYRPDGLVSTVPPRPGDFAELPDSWIVGLTGGELAEEVNFADLSSAESSGWLMAHGAGTPCRAMTVVRDRLLHELAHGSAHESLRRLLGLVRLAEEGHGGLLMAIGDVHTAFIAEATNPGRHGAARDSREAESEWRRSLDGALRRVLGKPSVGGLPDGDPCLNPFAGLIAPLSISSAQQLTVSVAVPLVPAAADQPAGGGPLEGAAEPAAAPIVEHTSWWPRDLEEVLSGASAEPPPAVLLREDKQALFYAGKVNGLLGESESGKTWVALLAVAQQLAAGGDVLYMDFEDGAAGIAGRLLALGVERQVLFSHFTYMDPDESLHAAASADLAVVSGLKPYAVVAIDGVNAAMNLLGLELESNTDATRFAQVLLRPLARTGAAVVTIDHVGKNKETRGKGGIGAQAKRAMVTGCSLAVEVMSPFGRGQTGKLKLSVDKDRGGYVRGLAQFSKNVGMAIMTSSPDGLNVSVAIQPPDERAAEERSAFRPTGLMTAVSRMLATTEGELSSKQVEDGIQGKREYIRSALDRLVEEGYASRRTGPRNAVLHAHVRPYRELLDLVADADD